MKVARLYRFGDIRIEEMPIPEVSHGEALIKVRASGICSGDVMPWYIEKKAPLVLGHEPSGEIVRLGNGTGRYAEGDRVFVHHHAPCLSCSFCLRGDYVQCPSWRESRIVPGGIAEYILIPELNLRNDTLILPEAVSFEDATLIEPTACVVKSLKRSGLKEGDTCVVIGLGVMGILHVMLASYYGAGRTIGVDRVPSRIKRAHNLGAENLINIEETPLRDGILSLTDGRGAEVVIVCPNSVDAMKGGLEVVAPGGTLLLFSPAHPGDILSFDPNRLYFNDITITTSYSCGPVDTGKALSLIRDRKIIATDIVTHRFPIERTLEAYEIVARGRDSLKVIIEF
jgi:L-iditol 2-dehydrogenase